MSEYQYYQWDTAGRLLTPAERRKVEVLSSHIAVTHGSAWVEYHWGDFKHDPVEVLIRHFDVLTYESNWGSQIVAFRFDAGRIDPATLAAFSVGESIEVIERGRHVVLCAWFDENWLEPDFREGGSRGFARLHADVIAGDHRSLFLLWLKACESMGEDEFPAATVPDGLAQLDEIHEELIAFVGVDPDLLEAARERSGTLPKSPARFIRPDFSIDLLDRERQRYFLERLLTSDPAEVQTELVRELTRLASPEARAPTSLLPVVPFFQLAREAKGMKQAREAARLAAEERKRREYFERLAKEEARIWSVAERLVATKQSKNYDLAVLLLKGLADLAQEHEAMDEFRTRARALADRFPKLPGFLSRMTIARFIEGPLRPYDRLRQDRWEHEHRDPLDLGLIDHAETLVG